MRPSRLAILTAGCLLSAAAAASDGAQTPEASLPAVGGAPSVTAPGNLPPVTAQMFRVGGRTELSPWTSVSLGDAFYRTVLVGVRGEHHLDERWSVAAHLGAGLSAVAPPLSLCGVDTCQGPAGDRLRTSPGDVQLELGTQLVWSPLYGKLSLIGEKTLHFDAYLALGPELLRERLAPDATSPMEGRWAFGGRFALGERVFLTDRFALRAAASELVYGERVRGTREFERKLSLELGVSWILGNR